MGKRWVALVRSTDIHPETRHSLGLPPALADDEIRAQALPWPTLLVIERRFDGVFLDRHDKNRQSAGDTWHLTVEDAKAQAEGEYEGLLAEWQEVPADIKEERLFDFAKGTLLES